MRVLIQKSKEASCVVDTKTVGKIKSGLVVFVGFTETDSEAEIEYLAKKIVNLRIFEDENKVMNNSLLDQENKQILSISQFTLYADTKKGNRPSYIHAANQENARVLYQKFNEELKKYVNVEEGIFQADMQIHLINDGPTTIFLER